MPRLPKSFVLNKSSLKRIQSILEYPTTKYVGVLLFIFALFGMDFSNAFLPKGANLVIWTISIFTGAIFFLEVITFSSIEPQYTFGFFWWLDIVSVVGLILEIAGLGHDGYSIGSGGGGNTLVRTSRMLHLVLRVCRLVRAVRMVALFRSILASMRKTSKPIPFRTSIGGKRTQVLFVFFIFWICSQAIQIHSTNNAIGVAELRLLESYEQIRNENSAAIVFENVLQTQQKLLYLSVSFPPSILEVDRSIVHLRDSEILQVVTKSGETVAKYDVSDIAAAEATYSFLLTLTAALILTIQLVCATMGLSTQLIAAVRNHVPALRRGRTRKDSEPLIQRVDPGEANKDGRNGEDVGDLDGTVQSLEQQNSELRAKVNALTQAHTTLQRKVSHELLDSYTMNLSSPFEKIIDILEGLRSQPDMKYSDKNGLSEAILTLQSSKFSELFSPQITEHIQQGKVMDSDLEAWLYSEVATATDQKKTSAKQHNHLSDILSTRIRVKHANTAFGMNTAILKLLPSEPAELEELGEIVSNLNNWEIDVWRISQLTKDQPLLYVSFIVFRKYGFFRKFKISDKTLISFIQNIEAKYHSNPYHNRQHATDVTLSGNYLLSAGGICEHLDDWQQFAFIVACIIHDVDHPGTNNAFEVKTRSERAILYNDQSPLENHHLAVTFRLLKKEENDIFSGLSKSQYKQVRELIVDLVLSTDLRTHFSTVSEVKTKKKSPDIIRQNCKLMLKLCIKMCDVGHSSKKQSLHLKWCDKITQEFFNQGDQERALHLEISPFCDRDNAKIGTSQVGFFNYIVTPLFDVAEPYLLTSAITHIQHNISENLLYWEKIEEDEKSQDAITAAEEEKENTSEESPFLQEREMSESHDQEEFAKEASKSLPDREISSETTDDVMWPNMSKSTSQADMQRLRKISMIEPWLEHSRVLRKRRNKSEEKTEDSRA